MRPRCGDSWAPIVRDLPGVLSVEVQTLGEKRGVDVQKGHGRIHALLLVSVGSAHVARRRSDRLEDSTS